MLMLYKSPDVTNTRSMLEGQFYLHFQTDV